MGTELIQETATQMPAVFCGPTADAAFFAAVGIAIFGLYSIYRLLAQRVGPTTLDD